MTAQTPAGEQEYIVVISDEERYSIWPSYKEIPLGWRVTEFSGGKEACLSHIEEVWTDMRPLSLRRLMDGEATQPQSGEGVS